MSTEQAPLPQYLFILDRKEIGRIRVGKHAERLYKAPGLPTGQLLVMAGFRRALPTGASRHMQRARAVASVEQVHINSEQLRVLEHDTNACLNIQLGTTPKVQLLIMSDRAHRIAFNKVNYGAGTESSPVAQITPREGSPDGEV